MTGPPYPRGAGRGASPARVAISRARTIRRGLWRSTVAARPGASACRRAALAAVPSPATSASSRARSSGSCGSASTSSPSATARSHSPVPPTRRATAPAAWSPLECPVGVADEVGDAEGLVGVDEVEPVMDDAAALLEGRLGRPDVEPAIDLARVGRDDLRVATRRSEREGEVDGEAGLPRGGRPADDDERRPARERGRLRAQARTPRSEYGPAAVTRTRTSRPMSVDGPVRWTSLFSRLRPDR